MIFAERIGLIVWTRDLKHARSFEKYGNVHYFSRKMQYVVLYVNASEEQQIRTQLEKMHSVLRVERSLRGEIPTEFSNSFADKTRTYSI